MKVAVKIEVRQRVDKRGRGHPETCGTCTKCQHVELVDGHSPGVVSELLYHFEDVCPNKEVNYYEEQK